MLSPRHRAFFVLWRLAEYPNPEPENPGNPYKQRKISGSTRVGGVITAGSIRIACYYSVIRDDNNLITLEPVRCAC